MKRSILRRSLVVLLALWLPVQSVVAAATPVCRHMSQHDIGVPAGHGHSGSALDVGAGDQNNGNDCEDCGLCALACASFLPAVSASVIPAGQSAPVPTVSRSSRLFFPQQPQRPPLASA